MQTITIPTATDNDAEARVLLAALADEKPTGLYSRRRVIDHLLDLRSTLPEHNRPFVDRILADVPGVTVVESAWWLDQISIIEGYLDHPVSG